MGTLIFGLSTIVKLSLNETHLQSTRQLHTYICCKFTP